MDKQTPQMADNGDSEVDLLTQGVDEDAAEDGASPDEVKVDPLSAEEVAAWLSKIEQALKREKNYRKKAVEVTRIYEAETAKENNFNILFSNTETLSPALYSTVPRPIASRRYKDSDPMALAVSQVIKRLVECQMDSGDMEESSFDELLKSAVLEALIPGRGVTAFNYEAELLPTGEYSEKVCGSDIPWDRFLHGYAKKWKHVPWICYEHKMSREELVEMFGKAGQEIQVTASSETNDDDTSKMDEEAKGEKLATIYQVWNKSDKRVHFFSDQPDAGGLKSIEDPLGLTGFFNCPEPLKFMNRVSGQLPIPPYKMYETQAEELNLITARINSLIKMMKVRGFYDGSLESVPKLLDSAEGTLMPLENVAALYSANGGSKLESAFWFMPIEKLVGVLQQLYSQREQVKRVIYEITGISDILRGSSAASETATAQNIKNQWGTLRLKNLQKAVARYARDCIRIIAEIGGSKFSPKLLKEMTGLPFPMQAEKDQAQQRIMMVQQQAQQMQLQQQQMQQQPPMPGMPPQQPPPPPPQPDPQDQQMVSMPAWEDISKLLKDDLLRNYQIDIETNSTIDPENSEDQKNLADLLNGLSQVMNGMAPLIQTGQMPFEVLKNLLLVVSRRFTFGAEIEADLQKMQQPPPPGPPPPDPAKEAEAKMRQQEGEMRMQELTAKMQNDKEMGAMKLELERAKAEMEKQRMNMQMQMDAQALQIAQAEHSLKMEELRKSSELAAATHGQKMQQVFLKQQQQQKPTVGA